MTRAATQVTAGWRATCECPPAPTVPAVVLDPFAGSGTTLAVAVQERRFGLGFEASTEYLRLAEARLQAAWEERDGALFARAGVSG